MTLTEVRAGGSGQTHSSALTASRAGWPLAFLLSSEAAAEGSSQCPLPRLSSRPACVIAAPLLCGAGVTLQLQEILILGIKWSLTGAIVRYLEGWGVKVS